MLLPEKYGGCTGPEAQYITLISSDGHEFIVKREVALISDTIKYMLNGSELFSETERNEITFREVPSLVLKTVCDYLVYNVKYTDSVAEIPGFDIRPEISLEVLHTANFLGC